MDARLLENCYRCRLSLVCLALDYDYKQLGRCMLCGQPTMYYYIIENRDTIRETWKRVMAITLDDNDSNCCNLAYTARNLTCWKCS